MQSTKIGEDDVVSPESLDVLFRPESFVLIGASEKSTFAKLLIGNLRDAGLGDRVHLVNPRSREVFGQRAYPSCADLECRVDLAYVMVPADAVFDALRSAADAGARAAVVLSSGFAEAGEEGRVRQERLVALAEELGIVVLGPNVLGFINVVDGIPAMALSDPPKRAGSVALISQSGASCGAMKDFAEMSGVDLSHVVTVGNEAVLAIADLAAHLIEDERVGALAIFMESIKKPNLFAQVARRAAHLGKPIVVLKAGRSELAARAAASHTGALVGDDRVVDAVLSDLGVIRVDTIEDMLVTAGLGAYTGPLPPGGLGVVSISGGACDIVADLSDEAGLALPELSAATTATLREALPHFGHAHNPLDITGAALARPGLWDAAIRAVGADGSISAVAVVNTIPWREDSRPFYGQRYVDEIGEALAALDKPGIYVTQVAQPILAEARGILAEARVPHAVAGLRGAVEGVAALGAWSRALERIRATAARAQSPGELETLELPAGSGALSELDARELLLREGVPFVPAVHSATPDEAGRIALEMWPDERVAIKIVSTDIAHKSDTGGVRLGVAPEDVAWASREILRDCAAGIPDARLDGVLVSPMRAPATELIIGITRDPDWGLMLAVGLGGIFVEVLRDVVVAPLPVTPSRVKNMLMSLKGRALLDGVRGTAPADLDAVSGAVMRIAEAALRTGDRLEALEINPLRVDGAVVEALDALIVRSEKIPAQ